VTELAASAALLVVAAAVRAGALALVRTRSLRQALPVFLDMLAAAGLLRLATAPTWRVLAVTAIVIVLRRLVTAGIHTATSARQAS
jgi:hypothetical protein